MKYEAISDKMKHIIDQLLIFVNQCVDRNYDKKRIFKDFNKFFVRDT